MLLISVAWSQLMTFDIFAASYNLDVGRKRVAFVG